MDINEYIDNLKSEILVDAEEEYIPEREAFLNKICNMLIESEVISEYHADYFYGVGRNNRKVEFDGYSYERADGTYNLFVVDDWYDDKENLTNEKIDKILKVAEEIVYCGLTGQYKKWEESTSGYEVGHNIHMLYENKNHLDNNQDLQRIRIYIFTTKQLSNRYKNKQRDDIENISVEFSIYDAKRIYDMVKSGLAKEPVDIDVTEFGFEGIPSILSSCNESEYISYLATIPGELLAQVYKMYGTRILESNVRAFLSTRGKVNKGIRRTILDQPEKFFLLNNGITVTANGVDLVENNGISLIQKIYDMQIVNGGQTTASLANALIKDKANLSKISVMMKLTVILKDELSEDLVSEISRASNSQNKVDEADFFSNHPYHIRIEELSNKTLAPAIDGNQYETIWFYERVRGKYEVEQMHMTTTESKKWKKKFPKNQKITKTDLAKYIMTYEGYPDVVSKGAQYAMKQFAKIIQGTDGKEGFWIQHSSEVNVDYYKQLIAKAIIFKETEKLVSSQDWYKEIRAYRANIVTYSIAYLSWIAKEYKKDIDLDKVWKIQKLYPELYEQLIITTEEIYQFLTRDDRIIQNVTEWAKKADCWKKLKKEHDLTIATQFLNSLVDIKVVKRGEVTQATGDNMNFVCNSDVNMWCSLLKWGQEYRYLDCWSDEELIKKIIKFKNNPIKIPTDKEFQQAVSIYNRLVNEGFKQ